MALRVATVLLIALAFIACSQARSANNQELDESTELKTRVVRDAEGRRRGRRRGRGKGRGRNGKKRGRKGSKKTKTGRRKIKTGRKTPRAVFKGSHCEYFELAKILDNSGCTNGFKFVIKQNTGVRKQFFILENKVILGFVKKGEKFTACTSAKDVTSSITCKEISGLSAVDLTGISDGTATGSAAATTAAAAAETTAAAAETTAAAAETTAAAAATTAAATTSAAASVTTAAAADDSYMTKVKGYIDASTCGTVSANSNCGTAATSYYKSFNYNGKNVIIASQVPDHAAEHDIINPNPNTRCEMWQYIQLPIEPSKGTSSSATSLGTIGLAVTGGAFFNDVASPQGELAMTREGPSLDSCFGHSAPGGAYHYHANINCTSAGAATGANDPTKCVLIGYYRDGVPIYGFCKDSNGVQYTSCYKINSGVTTSTVTTAGGTFSGLGAKNTDYTYDTAAFTAGSCNLDAGNGALHPTTGKYSYFTTFGYPWVPILFFGSEGAASLCSAA